eukprot:4001623-Pleurochrysis_carterae.AAC.2
MHVRQSQHAHISAGAYGRRSTFLRARVQAKGYIATVSCAEVWCEMTAEFYREYLKANAAVKRLLYAMNPNKFRACEYLMRFHEVRDTRIPDAFESRGGTLYTCTFPARFAVRALIRSVYL